MEREVAKEFQVSKGTLEYRLKKGIIVRGKVFSTEDEVYIVQYIKDQQKGYPLTKESFLELMNEYIRVE